MKINIPSTKFKVALTRQHVFAYLAAFLILLTLSLAVSFLLFGFEDIAKFFIRGNLIGAELTFLFPIVVFLSFMFLSKDRDIKNGISFAFLNFVLLLILSVVGAILLVTISIPSPYPINAIEYFLSTILSAIYSLFSGSIIYCGLFSALEKKNREYGFIGLIALLLIVLIFAYLTSESKPSFADLGWWGNNLGFIGGKAIVGFALATLIPQVKRMRVNTSKLVTVMGLPVMFGVVTGLYTMLVALVANKYEFSIAMNGIYILLQFFVFGLIFYVFKEVK